MFFSFFFSWPLGYLVLFYVGNEFLSLKLHNMRKIEISHRKYHSIFFIQLEYTT